MHWVYEQQARANVGKALREQGAALYGWHDDQSEPENDYYHPESWAGVATYQGYSIVVNCPAFVADDLNDLGILSAPIQMNPRGYSWHVEKDGAILARGKGLSRCCAHGLRHQITSPEEHHRLPREEAARLAAKILRAIEMLNGSATSPMLSQPASPISGMEPRLGGASR